MRATLHRPALRLPLLARLVPTALLPLAGLLLTALAAAPVAASARTTPARPDGDSVASIGRRPTGSSCQPGTYTEIYPCSSSESAPVDTSGVTVPYTIFNHSSSQERYDLSCTPTGMVASCQLSTDHVDIAADGSASITATYSTSTSPGSGSITLRAEGGRGDVATGTTSITVTIPPSADSTPPTVSLSPPSGTSQTTSSLAVTVNWADNNALAASSRSVTLNGTAVTGAFDYSGSSTAATSQGTVTLDAGSNDLVARICDTADNCASRSASYTYQTALSCSNEFVAISPCGLSRQMTPNSSESRTFTVTNNNGDGPLSYTTTCDATGVVTCSVSQSDLGNIRVGESASFTVNYSVDTTTGPGLAHVLVTGPGDDIAANINVTLPVYAVAVSPKGGSPITTMADTTTRTQNFTVQNTGSVQLVFDLEPSCSSNRELCTSSATSDTLTSGATATVQVFYHAYEYGTSGTVGLHATVRAYPAASDSGYVIVDVPVQPESTPVVTPNAAAFSALPHTGYTHSFIVRNAGEGAGTFELSVSCPSAGWSCGLQQTSVQLDPGDSTTVTVSDTTGATLVNGVVILRAASATDPSRVDSGWVDITVPVSVTLTPDGGSVGHVPGAAEYDFRLTTTLPASAQFNVTVSCPADGATDCFGPSEPVTASASQPADVPITYTAGPLGSAGSIAVTARQVGDPANADSGMITVLAVADTNCVGSYTSISPCIGTDTVAAGTMGSVTFTVTNMKSSAENYILACEVTGALESCGGGTPGVTIEENSSYTRTVSFQASDSLVGPGSVRLKAFGDGGDEVSGGINVTVVTPPIVTVAPKGKLVSAIASHSNVQRFTLKTTGQEMLSLALSTYCSDSATNCALSPGQPNPVTLAPGDSATVDVSYDAGAVRTMGTVWLTATAQSIFGTVADTGFVDVQPVEVYSVAVTPTGDRFVVKPGIKPAVIMYVHNTGTVPTTYSFEANCSGDIFAASGCWVLPDSVEILPDSTARVFAAVFDPISTIEGDSGRVTFTASQVSPAGTVSDEASVTLVGYTTHQDTAVVDVASVNAGSTVRRDLCLTVAAGRRAAWQCGDLRIAHALPSVRTMNRLRTPVLLYNSQLAHPRPVISAVATLSDSTKPPDSVRATLTINGSTVSRQWTGDHFGPGHSARIALSFDAVDYPTGVYPYTLTLSHIYNSPAATLSSSRTGTLIIVNRSKSPFGAGWWLAGLEQLYFPEGDTTSRLWVGGDGSARVYSRVASGVWAAPNVDRPDTLKLVGSNYVRYLPHGLQVLFDDKGRHVATINRMGHRTNFVPVPNTFLLDRIEVATPTSDLQKVYSFAYDMTATDTLLQSVTAPALEDAGREVTIQMTGGRITAITDPDTTTVRFGYDPQELNRIVADTGRRGEVTTYSYDVAGRLSSASLDLGTEGAITTRFRNLDSLPLAAGGTASEPDSSYVVVNGPRTDTTVTRFWLDRFGAPRRIVDALGFATTLKRDDPEWPALVTAVVDPLGHTTLASYDDQGNMTDLTDVHPYGGDTSAVTHMHYDPLWSFADTIITPTGVVTTFAYNAENGNRLWQQVGPDIARRVRFNYANPLQLLSSIELPLTAKDSIEYDTLGNLKAVRSPMNYWTTYERDSVGRVTLVSSAIDSADHGRGGGSSPRLEQHTEYDIMDRVVLSQRIGPAMSGAPQQTLTVESDYDDSGNRVALTRSSSPDIPNFPIGTITTHWVYDSAGRAKVEVAPDSERDSTVFDPAGNPVARYTRRRDESGNPYVLTMTYDVLNRLTSRSVPEVIYQDTLAGLGLRDGEPYPRRPTNSDSSYVIAAQTETFMYDPLGHLLAANNHDARVTRTYYPNGAIKSERQLLRDAEGESYSHVFLLRYSYDLDGRRTAVKLPAHLVPAGTRDSIAWSYSPQTGELSQVVDPLGNAFTYGYNDRGEPESLAYPGSYTERWSYSDDGRITGDTILNLDGTNAPRLPTALARATTFKYDARGKLLESTDATGYHQQIVATYTGLGMLATHQSWQNGELDGFQTEHEYKTDERQSYDALGNVYDAVTADTVWLNGILGPSTFRSRTATYEAGVGRLLFEGGVNKTYVYDRAGNLEFSMRARSAAPGPLVDRFTYYGADGRVRAADYRVVTDNRSDDSPRQWVFEEYRYDALGRRVWVRTYRDMEEIEPLSPSYLEAVTSTLRRTVWDGEQELIEIQVPGADSEPPAVLEGDDLLLLRPQLGGNKDPNPLFGRVVYIHGLGLDRPIAVTRYRYVDFFDGLNYTIFPPKTVSLFWTPRGQMGLALCADGGRLCTYNGHSMGFDYPQALYAYDRPRFSRRNFQGTLIVDKQDAAGTLYRRSRVYDPQTGRFTQEDPIGLAGGMNLYGFAGGDPVNYSDPFGLCPNPDGSPCSPMAQMVHDVNQRMTEAVVSLGLKTLEVLAAFGNAVTHVGDVTTLAGLNPTANNGDRAVAAVSLATGVATSAASGVRLAKQLASEELLGEAQAGIGISMAGAGSRKSIDDIARLVSEYGGESGDWAKMTTRTRVVGGTPISVHWYENVTSGLRVEFKTPINR